MDEGQKYVSQDHAFAEILDTAREAKIGVLMAMQDLSQIEDVRVRRAILTNTALKFCAKTSGDIHDLCRAMGGIEPEVIYRLQQYEFAHFGPNLESAIKVMFPKMDFTKMPQMTDDQYEEMRQINRDRYGYRPIEDSNMVEFPDPKPEPKRKAKKW
jgi:hypothetical protein